VNTLSRAAQTQLLAWLQCHYSAVQVVSTSSEPLLPLVDAGRFEAALFYALNVVHIELSAAALAGVPPVFSSTRE
jgi:transcriptional regulator of acetoin/glycerol metabolism